jgi:hypothetical protein
VTAALMVSANCLTQFPRSSAETAFWTSLPRISARWSLISACFSGAALASDFSNVSSSS